MKQMIIQINDTIHSIVWGPFMLVIMAGVGGYYTLKTNCFPIHCWKMILKCTIGEFSNHKKSKDKGTISSFQAAATSLAGCLGTGNIVGVATALVSGGAGSLFWMWISAFLGMMTKYAEILLSCHFKEKNKKGEWVGGPMYYIEKGLHQKWLAVIFSICCIFASFGMGNMTQVNSIVGAVQTIFPISGIWIGIIMALGVGFVIIGGMKRIAKFSSVIVPFFAVFYMIGSIIVLVTHSQNIPKALTQIVSEAFGLQTMGGGFLGYTMKNAIQYGFSRGVFSNEAGLGSAAIAHSTSVNENPAKEGMWGIFEVFLDTIVMCTITGLVILTTDVLGKGYNGAQLTLSAFSTTYGTGVSNLFLTVSIAFFAFSTLIGWAYYGEQCVEYLFHNKISVSVYKAIYLAAILIGSVMELTTVWKISDTFNGMMAIPNLIALIFLSKIVLHVTKSSDNRIKKIKTSI
jgi:AGCS family alanine or glycine:cation symporter